MAKLFYRLRLPGALLLCVLWLLMGVWGGMRMAGGREYDTALGSVWLSASPSARGQLDLYIPLADWGIRSYVFSAPIRLTATPRAINRPALISVASGDTRLIEQARQDAQGVARQELLRSLGIGLGGGIGASLVLALLWPALRRSTRVRVFLGASGFCALFVSGMLAWISHSFRPESLASPVYYARGAELAQLLEASERLREKGRSYRSNVQSSIASFAGLLQQSQSETPESTGQSVETALLASDLHNNVFALKALERFAADQPVFFAGDFGHDGNPGEIRLLSRLSGFGSRLVAVSGNHDSRALMMALADGGATVLTAEGRLDAQGKVTGPPVVKIGSWKVAGWNDPLEHTGNSPSDPKRIFSFAERPNGKQEYAQAAEQLYQWFSGLEVKPDILVLHQQGLAQRLAARLLREGYSLPLTVLTGHDHVQHIDFYGSSIAVVDAGTTGAGGQFGVGKEYIGVAQLRFDRASARLRSSDLIQVEPISKAAQAQRVVSANPDCQQEIIRCHPQEDEPAASEQEPPVEGEELGPRPSSSPSPPR